MGLKIKMSKKHRQDVGVHDGLLKMGFAYMEGSQTYLIEHETAFDMNHVILDCVAAESWPNVIECLGMHTFSPLVPIHVKMLHQNLAQEAMKIATYQAEKQLKIASNE